MAKAFDKGRLKLEKGTLLTILLLALPVKAEPALNTTANLTGIYEFRNLSIRIVMLNRTLIQN